MHHASTGPRPSKAADDTGTPSTKWAVLAAIVLGTFSFTLDGGMISVSYPALVKAFASDASTVVWVSTALFLTSISLILTIALLADIVGRKRFYVAGYILYVLSLALATFAPNIMALILTRVLQAVGGAMVMANGTALLVTAFPSSQRGTALGLNGMGVGLGLGLGPMIGGLLLDSLDWRALFWSRIPLGIIGILLAMAVLPSDHRQGEERPQVDYLGSVLLAATIIALLLAMNIAGRRGIDEPIVWTLSAASPLFLVLLLQVERRVTRPVLDLVQFRNRVFAAAQGTQFFHYAANGILVFLAAFFLVDGLGLNAVRAGMVLTLFPVMRVIGGPISGTLSDRFGSRLLTMASLLIMGIGLLLLAIFGREASVREAAILLGLTGLGSAFFEPPNNSAIMGSARQDRLSAAGASIAAGRQISQSVGFTLGGALFAMREGVHFGLGASQAVTAAFSDAMFVASALCFVGVGVSYLRGRA